MVLFRRIAGTAACLAVLSCLVACGGFSKVQQAKQRVQTSNDLRQIGLTYLNYLDSKGKPPASAEELITWARTNIAEAVPLLEQTRPGGRFVIKWGLNPRRAPEGSSNTVLGYESKATTEGGPVLLGDGAIMQMTAAELAARNKPAGK